MLFRRMPRWLLRRKKHALKLQRRSRKRNKLSRQDSSVRWKSFKRINLVAKALRRGAVKVGAKALPKSEKLINTFMGTEVLRVWSSCLTHVHIDTMITVGVSCPNANKVMTLSFCTTCSLFVYVLPRTVHYLVSMLGTVKFHDGYCLVLCFYTFNLFECNRWPLATQFWFGEVASYWLRQVATKPILSIRWQPNEWGDRIPPL